MSHGGEKSPQAKTLSAEVEPFVPNHVPPTNQGDGTTGDKSLQPPQQHYSDNAPKDQNSNVNIGELPSYMINCYPFVQDSCVTDVRWQGGGGGGQHHYPHQPYPTPHSEYYPPQQQQPLPYPGYYPGYPINPYAGYQPHQLPPPYPQGYPHKGGYRINRGGSKQNKNNRRRNKGGLTDTKSVGVQKTSSGEKVIIPSKDIKRRIKTVIYVDTCQQTDFPDDLANLSLLERPSSFRKAKAKNRRKSQQTRRTNISSTDSEIDEAQVDSDSGYSSPKHCRNLSVGSSTQGIVTQDAATGTPSSSNVPSTSNVNITTQSHTQATMASTAGPSVMSYAGAVAKAKVAPVVTPSAVDARTNVTQHDMLTQRNKSKVMGNSPNRNIHGEPHDRKEILRPTDTINRNIRGEPRDRNDILRPTETINRNIRGEPRDRNDILSPTDTINSTVSSDVASEMVAQPKKKKVPTATLR